MANDVKTNVDIEMKGIIQNREDDSNDLNEIVADDRGATDVSNEQLLTSSQSNWFGISNQAEDHEDESDNERETILGDVIVFAFVLVGIILTNMIENSEFWKVLTHVPKLSILVPTLPALLSNLHTLLVTWLQANDENSINTRNILRADRKDLPLKLAATMAFAFGSSIVLIPFDFITNENFSWANALVLVLSNMSFVPMHIIIAGLIVKAVLWLSQCFHTNPNKLVATLVTTSYDLISLLLFLLTATLLFQISTHPWFLFVAPIVCVVVLTVCVAILIQKKSAHCLIDSSWLPLLTTLIIYCAARLGTDSSKLNVFMDLHQIYSGINGYLISTYVVAKLVQSAEETDGGNFAQNEIIRESWKQCVKRGLKLAFELLKLSAPAHFLAILVTNYYRMMRLTFGLLEALYFALLMIFSTIDVTARTILALFTIRVMEKRKINRDNWKPWLTAFGDIFSFICLMLLLCLPTYNVNG